jgi:hypothetical protein
MPLSSRVRYSNNSRARGSTAAAKLFGVPCSQHISFFELTCIACSLDWARIVATVKVKSAVSCAKISA